MLEDFVRKGNGVKLKEISTDRGMWLRLSQNTFTFCRRISPLTMSEIM